MGIIDNPALKLGYFLPIVSTTGSVREPLYSRKGDLQIAHGGLETAGICGIVGRLCETAI